MMTGLQVAALFFSPPSRSSACASSCSISTSRTWLDCSGRSGGIRRPADPVPGLVIVVGIFMLIVSIAIVLYAFTGIFGDNSQI